MDASYTNLEVGLDFGDVLARIGAEYLGGSGATGDAWSNSFWDNHAT